jgi:PAS domain S-box-containing protein
MEDKILFETGGLSKEELKAVLNTLPVDITFVDREDTVRYFSDSKDRIFPRTKAIIGRKVQQCHPQKSVHIVDQILNDFKSGRKMKAEFWIPLQGRLIYIRYFALHDKNGDYLGCLEVTQDITDIKKIEGEKRLL